MSYIVIRLKLMSSFHKSTSQRRVVFCYEKEKIRVLGVQNICVLLSYSRMIVCQYLFTLSRTACERVGQAL